MKALFRLVAAFTAGAALMYYLDPTAGRRRRALVRDRGVAMGHDLAGRARAKSKRAADRLRGVVARSRSAMTNAPVDDDRLHDRIRAKLGHLLERPSAVEVHVQDGLVTLKGTVGAEEIDDVLDTVSGMLGVEGVESRLSIEGREADASAGSAVMREARH